MHYYKLENPDADEDFINKKSVWCKATLPHGLKIKPGDLIVVALSGGAKYKGRIVSFNPVTIGNYDIGEMEIRRV